MTNAFNKTEIPTYQRLLPGLLAMHSKLSKQRIYSPADKVMHEEMIKSFNEMAQKADMYDNIGKPVTFVCNNGLSLPKKKRMVYLEKPFVRPDSLKADFNVGEHELVAEHDNGYVIKNENGQQIKLAKSRFRHE